MGKMKEHEIEMQEHNLACSEEKFYMDWWGDTTVIATVQGINSFYKAAYDVALMREDNPHLDIPEDCPGIRTQAHREALRPII